SCQAAGDKDKGLVECQASAQAQGLLRVELVVPHNAVVAITHGNAFVGGLTTVLVNFKADHEGIIQVQVVTQVDAVGSALLDVARRVTRPPAPIVGGFCLERAEACVGADVCAPPLSFRLGGACSGCQQCCECDFLDLHCQFSLGPRLL